MLSYSTACTNYLKVFFVVLGLFGAAYTMEPCNYRNSPVINLSKPDAQHTIRNADGGITVWMSCGRDPNYGDGTVWVVGSRQLQYSIDLKVWYDTESKRIGGHKRALFPMRFFRLKPK